MTRGTRQALPASPMAGLQWSWARPWAHDQGEDPDATARSLRTQHHLAVLVDARPPHSDPLPRLRGGTLVLGRHDGLAGPADLAVRTAHTRLRDAARPGRLPPGDPG